MQLLRVIRVCVSVLFSIHINCQIEMIRSKPLRLCLQRAYHHNGRCIGFSTHTKMNEVQSKNVSVVVRKRKNH